MKPFSVNSVPPCFTFPPDSKQFLRLHHADASIVRFPSRVFQSHPPEEPYDLRRDPDQLINVADDASYIRSLQALRRQLKAELVKNADPRVLVGK